MLARAGRGRKPRAPQMRTPPSGGADGLRGLRDARDSGREGVGTRGLQREVLIGATTGVTATRTLSLLPGSSGKRDRNRAPL